MRIETINLPRWMASTSIGQLFGIVVISNNKWSFAWPYKWIWLIWFWCISFSNGSCGSGSMNNCVANALLAYSLKGNDYLPKELPIRHIYPIMAITEAKETTRSVNHCTANCYLPLVLPPNKVWCQDKLQALNYPCPVTFLTSHYLDWSC